MSLFSNISMLNSALGSFQYGLDVSANNIANSKTIGYSRQSLVLNSLPPIFDGNLLIGSGVGATDVSRIRDIFLDSRIKYELSELGRATAKTEVLTELAAIFPEVAVASSTAGLKGAIDDVVAAWTALSASPNSSVLKTGVLTALKAVADMLQLDARKTFDLQQRVDDDVNLVIGQINTLTEQIAAMNAQIKSHPGNGITGAPSVILDLREQAAEKLAQLIDVSFRMSNDGMMQVSFGTGMLVNGGQANKLTGIPSVYDPSRTAVGYADMPGGKIRDVSSSIQGGKLGGLLNVRDGDIEKARLDLNRIAYGIISRTNEINRTYKAVDGTSQHDLLNGKSAADIAINPIVTGTPDYVGGTRDAGAPGDLAKIQLQLKGFIQFSSMRTAPGWKQGTPTPIDPTTALSAQVSLGWAFGFTSPASQGRFFISTSGNDVPVDWDDSQSLNEIIRNINIGGAGAFYATYDETTQELIIVGQTPMTTYDVASNFLEAFGISSVVTSSAPINNYPVPGVNNQVDPFGAMNNTQNLLNLFSSPVSTGGVVLIDGNAVNWTVTDDISTTINLAISAATAAPYKVSLGFNAADQTVSIYRSGSPLSANLGVHNYGAGSTMQAVQIVDQKGNLTRTLNIDTNTNSSKILDELVVTVGGHKTAEGVLVQQAQALVDQTQDLQDAQSKVNLDKEMAQAVLYQRSYEASIRLQFIMDEILNVLINRTGSSASSGSSA